MDSDTIDFIKVDLQKCIEEGMQKYKFYMNNLLQHSQPLKESQLLQYHSIILKAITDSFAASYKSLAGTSFANDDGIIKEILTTARLKLDTLIDKQLHGVYLKKYETEMDIILEKIKKSLYAAEMLYDENVADDLLKSKMQRTKPYVTKMHEMWKTEALKLFNKQLKAESDSFSNEEFWSCELKQKLDDRWDEMREECGVEDSPKLLESRNPPEKQPLAQNCDKLLELRENQVKKPFNQSPFFLKLQAQFATPPRKNYYKNEFLNRKQIVSKAVNVSAIDKVTNIDAKRSAPTALAHKSKQNPVPTDIGFTIDKTTVKVSTFSKPSNSYELQKEIFVTIISPELYFADDSILIGEQAHKFCFTHNRRYFNVFDLITQARTTSLFDFTLNEVNYNLCNHQIIALFIKIALNSIETDVEINKIIFKIGYAVTSAMRERIQKSARIAGFEIFRIVSCLPEVELNAQVPRRSFLRLTTEKMKSTAKYWPINEDQFEEGPIFTQKLKINLIPNKHICFYMVLDQVITPPEIFNVGRYEITCKRRFSEESKTLELNHYKAELQNTALEIEIEFKCLMDADGVFTLHGDAICNFPVKIDVRRTDNWSCLSACQDPVCTGYVELFKFYERLPQSSRHYN